MVLKLTTAKRRPTITNNDGWARGRRTQHNVRMYLFVCVRVRACVRVCLLFIINTLCVPE